MATATILVADNDPALLPVLALHLRNEEYEVLCVEDGESALQTARSDRPDVLVVNVALSIGPRRSVHDYISDDPKLLAIPVIYLVDDRTSSRGGAPKLPAQSVIHKPVPIGELLAKIAAALGAPDDDRQKYAA